jgi:photosystem II stability/assembly factor-like uncharacterized protein
MTSLRARSLTAGAAVATALVAAATSGVPVTTLAAAAPHNVQYVEHMRPYQGAPGQEGEEARIAAEQYAFARTAPTGTVAPGAYDHAWAQLSGLPTYAASWNEVTNRRYDADSPLYRDPDFSNSSGGAGNVTGRITGIAVGADHTVYAGGANGGVFRSIDLGATWTPIADGLPTLSVGDLRLAPDGALWLATGEGNTGSTAYVGSGVYRLTSPRTSVFTAASRVGDNGDGTNGLAGTFINKVRFDDSGNAFAATSHGLYRHSATSASGAWTLLYFPHGDASSPYAGIVNDVAVKPGTHGREIVFNAAWRGYDTYNGFYTSTDGGATFTKINPGGSINGNRVGNAELEYSADGKKLYTVVEDTTFYLHNSQQGGTVLMGVFVSTSGPAGPWKTIAESRTLAASGSALKTNSDSRGYHPGVQAWYNNFIAVDPADSNHVFVGLEEVYETHDGGANWKTIGPYWNFGLACWDISNAKNTCPATTHSDQHAIAFGNGRVYVGNDGGLYSRPLNSTAVNANNNATDWANHNANLRTLQYYSVGTGYVDTDNDGDVDAADRSHGVAVSGGLQDNGGSLLLPGATTMVSPFGGDGGDIIVDPDNGCRILDEYVFLTLWVTTNCGATDGTTHAVKDVSVADPFPRFTAPFRADGANKDHWVAGGEYVWTYDHGFAISTGSDWVPQYDTGAGHSITGLSSNHDVVWAGWCGGCNPGSSFARGIVTNYGGTYHQVTLPAAMPNRYISNVVIDPNDADGSTAYVLFNGFSRRWLEGPGGYAAGTGHLWKTTDGGVTWTDASGNLPDVPADDLVVTPSGALVLGTDLGNVISTNGGASWMRLGGNHPLTTVMDLHVGPDGRLYSATHGRGIWSVPLPA